MFKLIDLEVMGGGSRIPTQMVSAVHHSSYGSDEKQVRLTSLTASGVQDHKSVNEQRGFAMGLSKCMHTPPGTTKIQVRQDTDKDGSSRTSDLWTRFGCRHDFSNESYWIIMRTSQVTPELLASWKHVSK